MRNTTGKRQKQQKTENRKKGIQKKKWELVKESRYEGLKDRSKERHIKNERQTKEERKPERKKR